MQQIELMELLHLARPKGRVKLVLDTDAYNEIDDQYAIAYALQSAEKLDVAAIYAAPFYATPFFPPVSGVERAASPADGMEKSYYEILHILDLMGRGDFGGAVCRGASRFMSRAGEPVSSPAAQDIIARALAMPEGERLYVAAIGAITNVASALLMRPEIKDKIVVIWLGGHAPWWVDNAAFNCMQDPLSAKTVFDCGVPVIHIPAMGVASHLQAAGAELRAALYGRNPLCNYLYEGTERWAKELRGTTHWAKTLWDVSTIAWLVGDDSWMYGHLVHSPVVTLEKTYGQTDTSRHFINQIQFVMRDKVLDDLFKKLVQ
jgi:inosine-uridine nucleoside N-ribohydrolase